MDEIVAQKIVIWWTSACRSIMPICRELAHLDNCEIQIVLEHKLASTREKLGWKPDLDDSVIFTILDRYKWKSQITKLLIDNHDSVHLFGGYQRLPKFRYGICTAYRLGVFVGILAESPLNMNTGFRGFVKNLYLAYVLPILTNRISKKVAFIGNLSGRNAAPLMKVGWPDKKIYPFGYFPAGRKLISRLPYVDGVVRILSLGFLERYKGNHILLAALDIIKDQCLFECHIVGDGPDRKYLERLSKKYSIDKRVIFHGFINDKKVEQLLTGSDILVCPGLKEPWGIRVNEGLHAGLAVVVSDGLGASELITKSGAGSVFSSGNVSQLADVIREITIDNNALHQKKMAALSYRQFITPNSATSYLLDVLAHVKRSSTEKPIAPWH